MEELPLPPSGRKPSRRGWKVASILIALFAVGIWSSMGAKKEVRLVVDGEERIIKTFARTVKDLIQENNIVLAKEDQIEPQLDSWLPRTATITIERAFPVTVKVDGKVQAIQTTKCTVGEALKKAGIFIGDDDLVTPAVGQIVKPNEEIMVVRRESKQITETESIPFAVHRRRDPTLEQGKTKVLEAGKAGVKEKTYLAVYHDGKLQEKKLIAEKVIKEPIDKIVLVGTKAPGGTVRTSRGLIRYRRKYTMTATAYTPRPKGGTGITASGLPARPGLVAVDPKVIPLKTRLYIPGYGFCLAADTGGAIKGMRIDLCFQTRQEALRFGRRKIEVYVLE